jgi:uncharacterized protein
MYYTQRQKQIVNHSRNKIKKFLDKYNAPGHSFDHADRVCKFAVEIAQNEKSDIFLCEMASLFHDLGRIENYGQSKEHSEISYEICKKWFREDKIYKNLTKQEKKIILYAVRNHQNDEANKYDVAWILRDADKLDAFGKDGLKRSLIFFKKDMKKIDLDLRLRYYNLYWLKTKTAKNILKERNLMKPIEKYYKKLLRSKIKH